MDEGIETKRRCYHIYADKVPERVLNRGRYRLNCMLEHDPKGIKAGEELERAEGELQAAIIAYLEAGGTPELVIRFLWQCFKWTRKE
jgi:hypothetical protein